MFYQTRHIVLVGIWDFGEHQTLGDQFMQKTRTFETVHWLSLVTVYERWQSGLKKSPKSFLNWGAASCDSNSSGWKIKRNTKHFTLLFLYNTSLVKHPSIQRIQTVVYWAANTLLTLFISFLKIKKLLYFYFLICTLKMYFNFSH